MNSGSDEEYLNVRETARLLQVHENTIRNWVANGVLESAKLPGARAHRFARTEVERLQRDRGESTSSVGRPLRQDGPELVGPFDLDGWAAREDAKGAFPELMDRLLAATPGISNVNVRSHEGTAAHGWDGTATSKGSSFFPKGELHFEFGTNEDPKTKANEDYDNRQGTLSTAKSAIFVFATPKNWPGGKTWATEKQGLGEYAGVEAFDAHRLISWIRTIPPVHYWLSERLGYSPRDAQTIKRWWKDFRNGLTLKLPAAFFVAGRKEASKSLLDRLNAAGKPSVAITVKASNETEALAFIFGSLEGTDLVSSAMVVNDRATWDRLVDSRTPLILVPTFQDPKVAGATQKGHRVILLAGESDIVSATTITLPRIDPISAHEALDKASKNYNENRRQVGLARRNMPAFLRSVSHDQRLSTPAWATDSTNSELLARLILVSTWSSSDADHEALEKLTGKSWAEIERTLKTLQRQGNPLYVPSGSSWQLGAPKEAAQLLLPLLVSSDFEVWREIVKEVLLATDPYLGMDFSTKVTAQMKGVRPKYSSELRNGIALSLALASWSDVPVQPHGSLDSVVDLIVREILDTAFGDASGALLQSLSDEMPLLAEAAPVAFLNAVEQDLERQGGPLLAGMFQDQDSDTMFGASSPHTGLLWALETLCWSPEYFHRAAELLALLSGIDPGGKLSNRPGQSFVSVLLGWVRQSGATTDEKLDLLTSLSTSVPDTTWPLLLGLLPQAHGFAIPPYTPKYRDWTPDTSSILMSDWAQFASGVLGLAINLATGTPSRWVPLVDNYEQLPPKGRSELLEALRNDVANSTWSADDSHDLWQMLDEKIHRHEEFSEAEWALHTDELKNLQAMAEVVASDSDPRRYISLFEWRTHYRRMAYGDEGFQEALGKAQIEALEEVTSQGIGALHSLAMSVKDTQALGWQLALIRNADNWDEQLIEWLDSPDDALRGTARAYAQNRILTQGWNWIESVYEKALLLKTQGKRLFASVIPFSSEYWSKLDKSTPELVAEYWSQGHLFLANKEEYEEAVDRLLAMGHPWAAIAVLSNYMHDKETKPDLDVVKNALTSLMATSEPMLDHSMSPYYVEQLLAFMESEAPDDPDLARYEFALFGLLHDKNPSLALFRALNESPEDFILMIRSLFRAEGAEKRETTAAEKQFANRSWEILREWKNIPGQRPDGTVDEELLREWVRTARLSFEESGHTSVGDEQIGEMLSASPTGTDGVWPAEAVREIIESTGSVRLETGLEIGLFNRRGVTSRSPYEGGTQERALQERYLGMSRALAPKWRRTSRVLKAIADSYGRDARREDEDAERDADRD
jgi:excisionase family DNA binding protein